VSLPARRQCSLPDLAGWPQLCRPGGFERFSQGCKAQRMPAVRQRGRPRRSDRQTSDGRDETQRSILCKVREHRVYLVGPCHQQPPGLAFGKSISAEKMTSSLPPSPTRLLVYCLVLWQSLWIFARFPWPGALQRSEGPELQACAKAAATSNNPHYLESFIEAICPVLPGVVWRPPDPRSATARYG